MFGITPREYQVEALETALVKRQEGVTRQLCVLPTGTGKTVLFGMLAKSLNKKTLIIAHREQLIKQARDKIRLVWPEADIGICMAEENDISAQVVIASIQSASRSNRTEQLKRQGFSLCVVDEAHHSGSHSYQTLFKELGFLRSDPEKFLFGLTATPSRKGEGLGNIFQEIVFERSIGAMIKAGYLSDLKGKRILTATSLNSVGSVEGDFMGRQLSEVCNTPGRNALIADSFLEHCSERKGIAFTCDVQHAIDLAKTLNDKGIRASAIYGEMEGEEKASIMDRFSSGELQILTNCALLTEGYDEPSISTVLMCRPTRSQSLYVQCVGRGTRLHPGKANCLVLDFCDNYHNIQSIATLEKTVSLPKEKKEEDEEDEARVKQEKGPRTVFIGKEFVGDFELFDRSRFAWVSVKEHWVLKLSQDVTLWLRKDAEGYIPSIESEGRFSTLSTRALPLDYAMGSAEDWARKNNQNAWASKDASWRQGRATDKQIQTLKKLGYEFEKDISKGDAFNLIGKMCGESNLWKTEPATSKQVFFLRSQGVKFPENLTKGKAQELISKLKETAGSKT